jgi:hypothetical protein
MWYISVRIIINYNAAEYFTPDLLAAPMEDSLPLLHNEQMYVRQDSISQYNMITSQIERLRNRDAYQTT